MLTSIENKFGSVWIISVIKMVSNLTSNLLGGIQVLRHQRGGWMGWPNDDVWWQGGRVGWSTLFAYAEKKSVTWIKQINDILERINRFQVSFDTGDGHFLVNSLITSSFSQPHPPTLSSNIIIWPPHPPTSLMT